MLGGGGRWDSWVRDKRLLLQLAGSKSFMFVLLFFPPTPQERVQGGTGGFSAHIWEPLTQEISFIIGRQPSCVVLNQGGADTFVILGCEQTFPLLQRVVELFTIQTSSTGESGIEESLCFCLLKQTCRNERAREKCYPIIDCLLKSYL